MGESALRQMIENEHAQCHGETIPHVCGMRSRIERVAKARVELDTAHAREAALVAALRECHSNLQDYVNNYMAGERWKDHPEMRAKQKVCDRARAAIDSAGGAG